MAIVCVMRFNEHSGCICVDRESWFLRNRKSFFSDSLFSCVPEEVKNQGIEILLGGVGYPPFHYEVYLGAKKEIKRFLFSEDINYATLRVEELARYVLKSTQEIHGKRIDNRLKFLFGFTRDDFNAECYKKNGKTFQIKQEKIKKRVGNIIEMKEKPQDTTLILPSNEACIAGISPSDGFHAYCIKEQDGVLSFYSCGFDCLGVGKYAAGSAFANTINQYNVENRRTGVGKEEGLLTVFMAVIEAWEHYSQIGGNIRLVVLDSYATGEKRIREISDCNSFICIEVVKAYRNNILGKEDTINIITRVVFENLPWQEAEKLMFEKSSNIYELDKLLRNYKMNNEAIKITWDIEDIYKKEILPL
ncbi:MAG TPA: hypothetical protein PL110_15800 [Candidatus Eremiobacteraeota bacterium]|nr:MAG: hypothetical protein BWY64_01711 [bacterium ADurb.Bin363]HPZ09566.1 hypothetical protein [Candidatus Eremiobacteraeota bacterium]